MLHLACNCKPPDTSQCFDKRLAYRFRDSSERTVTSFIYVCKNKCLLSNWAGSKGFPARQPKTTVSANLVGFSLSHSCSETSNKPKSSPITHIPISSHSLGQHHSSWINGGFHPVRKQNVPKSLEFLTIDSRMMPYPARRRVWWSERGDGWSCGETVVNHSPQKMVSPMEWG